MEIENQEFTVHLYKSVRIKFENIEAATPEEAMQKADEKCAYSDWHRQEQVVDEEAPALGALVDFPDDPEYNKTAYIQGPSATLYLKAGDGRVPAIHVSAGQVAALAKLLSDARDAWADGDFENLGGILSGDVCRDVLDSVENKSPIDPELLSELTGQARGREVIDSAREKEKASQAAAPRQKG